MPEEPFSLSVDYTLRVGGIVRQRRGDHGAVVFLGESGEIVAFAAGGHPHVKAMDDSAPLDTFDLVEMTVRGRILQCYPEAITDAQRHCLDSVFSILAATPDWPTLFVQELYAVEGVQS